MTYHLEDKKIDVKIILAFFWTAMMFCYLYADVFAFFIPGFIDEIIAGEAPVGSQVSLLGATVLMAIPSVMIVLSLMLKAKLNRWTNIVIGIFYTAVNIVLNFVLEIFATEPNIYFMFYAIIESVLTVLIVWYAWKWPTQQG